MEAAQPVRPPAWTEEMLRSWEKSLHTVQELDVVWRVCSESCPPGLRGQVITRYISPELTGKSALTARGVVSRRMNTAARQVWARFVIDEVKRTRTVDRSVAVILLGALAEHPVWLQLRHRSSRPALGSRSQPPARPLPRASQARESNCPPAPARRRLRPEVGPGLGVLADAERLRFPAAVA
ncbi:hypothetical protein OG458_04690 [Streptomyces sp. NBC_01281]|uniref:hypothetical protein n=1 Tax=Streptomyces sp. NBC_01281 TaxID=2903811 RepID=UPI002E0F7288|nr:hypothetical protein OG458_04690 [Streptomyces sp. NBC_01281]